MSRIQKTFRNEFQQLHPRLITAQLAMALLPPFVLNRLRTQILRMAGIKIGRNTLFFGTPIIMGVRDPSPPLSIGTNCLFSIQISFDLAAPITIGNNVNISHQTIFQTGTHKIGPPENRLGELTPYPIQVEDGVWIGIRTTVLPGVTIGAGSIVGAGALVNRDVPPHTIVAGVPAKVIREIPPS